MRRFIYASLFAVLSSMVFSGCSLKYAVDPPPQAGFSYQKSGVKQLVLQVVDQRDDTKYMVGISGLQNVELSLSNVADPVAWFGDALIAELNGRGMSVRLSRQDSTIPADLVLKVKKYQLINHRASGFSAWESYHLFLGQLLAGEKSCLIPSFFFNSKLPVWSMDEIQKPCVSDPMAALVKDVASKINRCAFNYAVSDQDVEKMIERVNTFAKENSSNVCFPLIELGGTNNLHAVSTLRKFAEHDDSFVHNCAVSAIGTLGVQSQFEFLENRFGYFAANDRVMPVKAIGDLGGGKSDEFLRQVRSSKLYAEEYGVKYCTDLYLTK